VKHYKLVEFLSIFIISSPLLDKQQTQNRRWRVFNGAALC